MQEEREVPAVRTDRGEHQAPGFQTIRTRITSTVAAVATSLYLGGWFGPFLPTWLGWLWFLLKVFLILFFYVWMRWTLPRYRYDQLMEFGWKYLLPVAVVNLLVTAGLVLWLQ